MSEKVRIPGQNVSHLCDDACDNDEHFDLISVSDFKPDPETQMKLSDC